MIRNKPGDFDMTTVGGDSRILAAAARASVARFRELAEAMDGAARVAAAEGGY